MYEKLEHLSRSADRRRTTPNPVIRRTGPWPGRIFEFFRQQKHGNSIAAALGIGKHTVWPYKTLMTMNKHISIQKHKGRGRAPLAKL